MESEKLVEVTGNRLKLIGVYLLLGPPVGGAFAFTLGCAYVLANPSPASFGEVLAAILQLPAAFLTCVLFSYFFGSAQALATGITLAAISRNGRVGYAEALIVAAIWSAIGAFLLVGDASWLAVTIATIGVLASFTLRALFSGVFSADRDRITPA